MEQLDIKQVIVYRRDLNMRKGKIASQCCHASMKVFFDRGVVVPRTNQGKPEKRLEVSLTADMASWVETLFGKIVLSVENETDLLRIYGLAQEAGIPTALVTDAGRTEFKKLCETCGGLGYREWLTGCSECGGDPHKGEEECPGPDESCGTCKGTGKVSVPTHTTVALGPARAEDIDRITGPGGLVSCKLA